MSAAISTSVLFTYSTKREGERERERERDKDGLKERDRDIERHIGGHRKEDSLEVKEFRRKNISYH